MPLFFYKGLERNDHAATGIVEASSIEGAASILHEKGLFIIKLSAHGTGWLSGLQHFSYSKAGFNDVVNFTRQLATMMSAGLPLTNSLLILERQTTNQHMKKTIGEILHEIEGGSSLAKACSAFPSLFSPVYIALLRAGEAAGVIEQIMSRLADTMEKSREFKGKVKGALIYPMLIVCAMIGVVVLMMIFVIPKLAALYKDLGADLPFVTQVVVAISNFFVNFWWVIILGSTGFIIAFNYWKKTSTGRHAIDKVKLSIPIVGPLMNEVMLTEFCRTLSILIGAGVPMLEALTIVSDTMNNVYYQESMADVLNKVEKGSALSEPIMENALFPPILGQMIGVGEQTGKMDDTLMRLARYFEIESDEKVKGLTTAIEPIIMVVMGGGVGILVWSILSPIYNIANQIK